MTEVNGYPVGACCPAGATAAPNLVLALLANEEVAVCVPPCATRPCPAPRIEGGYPVGIDFVCCDEGATCSSIEVTEGLEVGLCCPNGESVHPQLSFAEPLICCAEGSQPCTSVSSSGSNGVCCAGPCVPAGSFGEICCPEPNLVVTSINGQPICAAENACVDLLSDSTMATACGPDSECARFSDEPLAPGTSIYAGLCCPVGSVLTPPGNAPFSLLDYFLEVLEVLRAGEGELPTLPAPICCPSDQVCTNPENGFVHCCAGE
jgi:hypothetical protein